MSPMLCQTLRLDAMGFVDSGAGRFSWGQQSKKFSMKVVAF